MTHPLHNELIVIDGVQYSHWSREVFEMMRDGGLTGVHVTVTYWENTIETLRNLRQWKQWFQQHSDLIMPIKTVADIHKAKQLGK